jgi:GNAT superfamily N-acetyltransferase
MTLESRIQDALRHHAPRGRETLKIGPLLATFTRETDNPYLNYAIPDDGASPTARDVAALVAAYRERERTPRLEYIPSIAPDVEAALRAAGFEEESRTPLMTCTLPRFEIPSGIELVAPRTEDDYRGAAQVQWEAYEEHALLEQRAVDTLRQTAEGGGVVVLARDADNDEPAGAGLCVAPHDGVTELAAVGVRERFRRRGIAAAMTGWLTQEAYARGMELVFLMAHGADEARIYERVGFVECGEVLHISLSEGRNRS